MKRTILKAFAALALLVGSMGTANAQVEQGSFMIDPYVGFPTANIWWSQTFDLNNVDGYSTAGSPVSFGGRLEYMVADNFGLGLDGNYAIAGFKYNEDRYDTTGTLVTGEYKYTSKKLRIMFRANYHFVQTENLDVYVGFGAGYKYVKRTATWNGGNDDASITGSLLPIATRIAIGGRYYFHPNIGINWELGAGGGGVLQAGLAVKF
ncbi:MAG: outer membrane beta-barrel protein [Crocinitomicaceae bacterium]|nr:outer membrane beta-barrel protein [Crocinitomicaceae bacterium]